MTMMEWLLGRRYSVKICPDGTGVIYIPPNSRPVRITTSAATDIQRAVSELVDRLAADAATRPAPW